MTQRPLAEDAYGNASVILFPIGSSEVDDATDDRLTGGNGSIRAQSDDLGENSKTADYEIWGTELSSTTSSLFSWTGEQNDDETGLTYLRARYYSPTYSRFLSTDPIQPNAGGTQGFNAYAYAQNNPTTLPDPSGMLAENDLSDIANSKVVSRSKAIIGCMLRNSNIVSQTACVLPLLGLTGENIRRAGRSIRDFVNDHPCTEQCRTIVKWAPIVAVVSIVLIACFPECLIILATPEAGAAAGSAGYLATRFPQVQAGLAKLLQMLGRTPATARATQNLEPEVRELTGIERSRILGVTGERLAGIVQRAKVSIPSLTGTARNRIPDDVTETTLTEVKNVGYLRFTPQLRDYLVYVTENGKRFNLIVRENTVLSGELQRIIDAPGSPITLIRGLPPL